MGGGRQGSTTVPLGLHTKANSDYRTYVVPLVAGTDFPKLTKAGFQSEAEVSKAAVQVLDGILVPVRTVLSTQLAAALHTGLFTAFQRSCCGKIW